MNDGKDERKDRRERLKELEGIKTENQDAIT